MRRKISVILSVLMLLGILTGCGGTASEDVDSGVQTAQENDTGENLPYLSTITYKFNDFFGTKRRKICKTQKNRCGNAPQRLLFMWLKRRNP